MHTSRIRSRSAVIVFLVLTIAVVVGGTAHAFYGAMRGVIQEEAAERTLSPLLDAGSRNP